MADGQVRIALLMIYNVQYVSNKPACHFVYLLGCGVKSDYFNLEFLFFFCFIMLCLKFTSSGIIIKEPKSRKENKPLLGYHLMFKHKIVILN